MGALATMSVRVRVIKYVICGMGHKRVFRGIPGPQGRCPSNATTRPYLIGKRDLLALDSIPLGLHPGCVSGIILNPSLALVRVKPATRLARGLEVSGINRSSFKAKPLLRSYRSLAELPCSSDSHLPRARNMTNRTTTYPVM